MPGFLTFRVPPASVNDVLVRCVFQGAEVVTPFGRRVPAGKPYEFSWSKFDAPIQWHVRWYHWDKDSDPRQPGGWETMLKGPAIDHDDPVGPLKYAGGSMFKGLPPDHYGTVADGTISVPAGSYMLKLVTDDGARVSVDGEPVITDAWHYQGPTGYQAVLKLSAGSHRIHVEHFQIDGYATLQVELAKP